jgi:hypothetical protein
MKYEVLVFEPNLDDRKPFSQLFPLKKYLVKFCSNYSEMEAQIADKIPHIVLISLDKPLKDFNHLLPEETFIIGITKNEKHPFLSGLEDHGYTDVWRKPIVGVQVIPKISDLFDSIKPLKLVMRNPRLLAASVSGSIEALGEADFIVDVPFNVKRGSQLNIHSELIVSILGEMKPSAVTKNLEGGHLKSGKALKLTLLGLNNEELQEMRAKVLHWDKI